MKKIILVLGFVAAFVANSASAQYVDDKKKDDENSFKLKGPSIHLAGGVRMKKPPETDTVFGGVLGLKVSPFSLMTGSPMYMTFLAAGVYYMDNEQRIAFVYSPIIFSHVSGIGVALDIYATRHDRLGGQLGFSLNLDILQLASFVSSFMK